MFTSSPLSVLDHLHSIRKHADCAFIEAALGGIHCLVESSDDVDSLITKIGTEGYQHSLRDMTEFLTHYITDKRAYQDNLEKIAVNMYREFRESEKQLEIEMATLPDSAIPAFSELMKAINSHMKTEDVPDEVIVDEVEHEHPRIERELDATKLDSLVKKAVANEKLNQLYHRIKDTFLPQLMHI